MLTSFEDSKSNILRINLRSKKSWRSASFKPRSLRVEYYEASVHPLRLPAPAIETLFMTVNINKQITTYYNITPLILKLKMPALALNR